MAARVYGTFVACSATAVLAFLALRPGRRLGQGSIPAPPDISKLAAIIRDLNGDIIPHAEVTLKGAGTVTTEIAQEGSANGMLP
jgi:hypothetical protein